MPFSTRMKWPFPREGQDPWFDPFNSMVQAMDTSGFASRENDAIALMNGGILAFNSSTGLVSWDGTIEVLAGLSGFVWQIAPSQISLQEGDVLFIDAPRAPTGNVVLSPKKASRVPNTDRAIFLAVRRGGVVFWRNGKVLVDGESIKLFEVSGGGAVISVAGKTGSVTLDIADISGIGSPTTVGQVLYSKDGTTFEAVTPLTSSGGWLVNDDGLLLIVE